MREESVPLELNEDPFAAAAVRGNQSAGYKK